MDSGMRPQRGSERRGRLGGVACLVLLVPAAAAADAWNAAWLPRDVRMLVRVDPERAARQPLADAFVAARARVDALASRSVAPRSVVFAYGPAVSALAYVTVAGSITQRYERIRGQGLGREAGMVLYRARSRPQAALVQVGESTLIEGAPEAVRAAVRGPQHSGDEAASALLALAAGGAAVTLVHLDSQGSDLHAILADMDRCLGGTSGAVLEAYALPLRALGTVRGLRLDLEQVGPRLRLVFHLAMANRIAAQVACATLTTARTLAGPLTSAAVRAGDLTAEEARILDGALETLVAETTGERVRVTVDVVPELLDLGRD